MTEYYKTIANIRKGNTLYKLREELLYTKNSGRVPVLKEKISVFENVEEVDTRSDFAKMQDKLKIMATKKPWHRLQNFHRADKLEEYLRKKYSSEDFYDKLITEVRDLAISGKLNTMKSVTYCMDTHSIKNIPCLKVTDNSYTIKC